MLNQIIWGAIVSSPTAKEGERKASLESSFHAPSIWATQTGLGVFGRSGWRVQGWEGGLGRNGEQV